MSEKFIVPIMLIVIISTIAPMSVNVGESIEKDSIDNDMIINSSNSDCFNQSLIIKNNTNFRKKADEYNWTGNGTEIEPFIITDYNFKMDKEQTAIFIENTDVNFVIKNCNISNSSCGVVLLKVKNATIKDNRFYKDECGVRIFNSKHNSINNNDFEKIESYSIRVEENSFDNEFHNNSMWGSGFYFTGGKDTYTGQIISEDNTVNDKPVYYLTSKNLENKSVTGDKGQIIMADCSYGRIEYIDISDTYIGITIAYSSNLILNDLNVTDMKFSSIKIVNSENIRITDVNSSNNHHGIYFKDVKNSTISGNNISNNINRGVSLIYSDNNIIENNMIGHNQGNGLDIFSSNSNVIKENNIIKNNNNGIYLHTYTTIDTNNTDSGDYSSNNTILNNIIRSNQEYGVKLSGYTENNRVYLNSFLYNQGSNDSYDESTIQAFEEDINDTESNYWFSMDEFGNYWRDWTGPDNNDDHIVDKTYKIDGDHAEDDFPLTSYMSPVSRFSSYPGKKDIELRWSKPEYSIIYPIKQYKLYKGFGKTNLSLYKTFNSSTYSFKDTNVTSEHTYFYKIEVINKKGDTAFSEIISSSPDNIPPEVLDHSPSNSGVPIDTNITVEFSELMDKNSVEVEILEENTKINGKAIWDGKNLTFDPNKNLDYKTTYTVNVYGKDRAGNNLSTDTWTFKTKIVIKVTGKIVDPEGKPISNVVIKSDTGKNTTTDSEGRFEILLKPGKRMLTIQKEGFDDEKIEIEVGSEGPKELKKINLKKSESGGNNWFLPMAIFGITTTILAIIAVIAFFKEREKSEEEMQDEEEFYRDLYEEDFEEVSKEEFESWWDEKD